MTRVLWAPQAIQDVEAIRAHVARDSARYADLVAERIVAAVERLQDQPRSGRVVPELGDASIREVIHGNQSKMVFFQGSPENDYESTMKFLDMARASGAKNIGIIVEAAQ